MKPTLPALSHMTVTESDDESKDEVSKTSKYKAGNHTKSVYICSDHYCWALIMYQVLIYVLRVLHGLRTPLHGITCVNQLSLGFPASVTPKSPLV